MCFGATSRNSKRPIKDAYGIRALKPGLNSEASRTWMIQTAMNLGLPLVCIDETAGRRVARLCDLTLTGSIGVLLKAKHLGYAISMPEAIAKMRHQGIWLSDRVVQFALNH